MHRSPYRRDGSGRYGDWKARLVRGTLCHVDVNVSQRAKLSHRVLLRSFLILVVVSVAGCRGGGGTMTPIYDPATRELIRLDYDTNGDGRVDVRTYMAGGRPVRLEGDQDGDGKLDRWEYYGPDGALLKLGTSSARDGVEDTWLFQSGGADRRIEIATGRDGIVDRFEFYAGPDLVRVETDANRDGVIDHWEQYDHGNLSRLSMDDERHPGKPVRRLTYAEGREPLLEVDVNGDGNFKPAAR